MSRSVLLLSRWRQKAEKEEKENRNFKENKLERKTKRKEYEIMQCRKMNIDR